MRFDVVTLFPEMFSALTQWGITGRACEKSLTSVHLWNPRDFCSDVRKTVDDRAYGGGPGMVMMAEPLALCVQAIQDDRGKLGQNKAPVILFSPVGERLAQHHVQELSEASDGAILICGRYEGLDQRFIDHFVSRQLSLGDFVLSGGEVPCLALLDALARLQPDVLHDTKSHEMDSFQPSLGGLLDCPHYTRPEIWREQAVPSVLLSGHHQDIEKWRQEKRLELTRQLRPDLLKNTL
jgi:tRNA (guanine37-N1)-methyltransferase